MGEILLEGQMLSIGEVALSRGLKNYAILGMRISH
jgi:hypothetical protein